MPGKNTTDSQSGKTETRQATIIAVNKLQIARTCQTVEVSAADLASVGQFDLSRIHIRDKAGEEVLCQAVDSDGDSAPDQLIFQTDFTAGQTLTFTATMGEKRRYTKEQFRAYGRFVRERYDDFCWENDRIAHRMYGKALETWESNPLTSSTVDVWSKNTPRMVINDWYMVDDYHVDHGEGGDFYSAGLSRGCGGSGLWAADRLWVSKNFVDSRQLANGPIRVVFELFYEAFPVDGVMVSEVKRISLDAGQYLNHYQSTYKPEKPTSLIAAPGLKKVAGERWEMNGERGWLAKWEPMEEDMGEQGVAIIVDPDFYEKQAEDELNLLVLSRVSPENTVSYWCGFCWDKVEPLNTHDAWKTYVDHFAQGLLSPIEVTVSSA